MKSFETILDNLCDEKGIPDSRQVLYGTYSKAISILTQAANIYAKQFMQEINKNQYDN